MRCFLKYDHVLHNIVSEIRMIDCYQRTRMKYYIIKGKELLGVVNHVTHSILRVSLL